MSKKRNKKSNVFRKPHSRRKKTDWKFLLELVQTAIAIYQVLFD